MTQHTKTIKVYLKDIPRLRQLRAQLERATHYEKTLSYAAVINQLLNERDGNPKARAGGKSS